MSHYSSDSVLHSSSSLDTLLRAIPTQSLLQSFARYYLQAVSATPLLALDVPALIRFLEARLEHVMALVQGETRLVVSEIPRTDQLPARVALDCVGTDAVFLVMTLNEWCRQMGLSVTQLIHPIVGVTRNQAGCITAFVSPLDATDRLSVTHIVFDGVSAMQLNAWLPQLKRHMGAVHVSHDDQAIIHEGLATLRHAMGTSLPALSEPKEEWVNLLQWLADDNFSFFGHVRVTHLGKNVSIVPDSCSGIFRSVSGYDATPLLESARRHSEWLSGNGDDYVLDTLPLPSPILRFDHLMRLGFRIGRGDQITEYVWVGLLKRSSLFVKNLDTPLIHLKMKAIFESKGMIPNSYDYNEVIRIFTAIPKFELFRSSQVHLQFIVDTLLSIANPSELWVAARRKRNGRQFVMVVIPDALTSRRNIDVVMARVREWFQLSDQDPGLEWIEVSSPEHTRLHVYFSGHTQVTTGSIGDLQSQLRQAIQPWKLTLRRALERRVPEQAGEWFQRYRVAFPDHHKVRRTVDSTVTDIQWLEQMRITGEMQLNLTDFESPGSSMDKKVSNLSIYNPVKLDLIQIMPVLEQAGLYVFDELTTRVGEGDGVVGYIHSFRVGKADRTMITDGDTIHRLLVLLKAVFLQHTENDPLNRLVIEAGLSWREVNVMQTYRNLLIQLKCSVSSEKINRIWLAHPMVIAAMMRLFHARFSPDQPHREAAMATAEADLETALSAVPGVEEDRLFRRVKNVMMVTLRTNFYRHDPSVHTHISIKLDSTRITAVPLPAPYREIYVHDVGMEGTHLRFGPIARGGLRWSDRPDDFRTEVLGLVKTQQTKNVVIVPVGSKGGFVLKRTGLSRDEWAQEGVLQYRRFIAALLDITDTLQPDGTIQPPEKVVCHDDPDPYLVVAADKGTASFSDIANEVAGSYGFWLGDAFASGGSKGYSHKKEGITARGAWECVRLHFSGLGKDIQSEAFTVAGIGDMSGDVFGNGMLLSPMIQLQAAFNHAHIFIDPTPDLRASFEERSRLFALPRSAWTDYDPAVISEGGGVFERSAKSIVVTPQMKALLDIEEHTISGEGLIRAILQMRVELMWLGGIGSYYKASDQSDASVGDPANDGVRVSIANCRAMVIGEGANLGVTHPARIEYAQRGGCINTDAIDNSAGVNFSDYEVNIKVLLGQWVANGVLSESERNECLEAATNEVALLVLANNRGQHRLLTMDHMRSQSNGVMVVQLVEDMVASGMLDAQTEQLPVGEALRAFESGMPRPILAVIQAYIKMQVFEALMADELPDDPAFQPLYEGYFPSLIRQRVAGPLPQHRLQRHIVATLLTNRMVNQAGSLFFYETGLITGASIPRMAMAYWVLDHALGLGALRSALAQSGLGEQAICSAVVAIEDQLKSLVQSVLLIPGWPLSLANLSMIQSQLTAWPLPDPTDAMLAPWVEKGLPVTLAQGVVRGYQLTALAEVLALGGDQAREWIDAVTQRLGIQSFKQMVTALHPTSEWEVTHQGLLWGGVMRATLLIAGALRDRYPTMGPEAALDTWLSTPPEGVKRLRALVDDETVCRTPTFSICAVGAGLLDGVAYSLSS